MHLLNSNGLKGLRQKLRKSQTPEERILWNLLRNRRISNLKFFRQYSIGNFILDFYCPEIKLAIEVDGGQHNLPQRSIKDINRTAYLASNKISVIRFWNNEVKENPVGVYDKILQTIKTLKS